jgi:ribonuclease E
VIEDAPVEPKKADEEPRRARRSRGRGTKQDSSEAARPSAPSPKDVAAMARHHDEHPDDDLADHEDDLADHEDDLADHEDDLDDDHASVDDASAELPQQAEPDRSDGDEPDDTSVAAAEALTEATPVESPTDVADDLSLEPEVEPEPEVEVEAEPGTEPDPEPAPPAEPEKPRVVTRTRRRSASRPAGPPTAVAESAGATVTDGGGGVDVDGAEHGADGSPALHVPVKRKGARKR